MTLLIETTLRASVLLLLILALLPFLKRRSAALRHWVLAVGLAAAALQPPLSAVIPDFTLPHLGRRAALDVAPASEPLVQRDVSIETVIELPDLGTAVGADVAAVLVGIWAAGAALQVAVLGAGLLRLRRLRFHSAAAGAEWTALLQACGRSDVRLYVTRHPAVLVTYGVRVPVILLPAAAHQWDAARRRIVMAHELAHVARRDWAVQLAAEALRACCWFNPLFWIACARLRHESEQACDDVVLAQGIDRTSYAGHLVALARAFQTHGRTSLPAPAGARPSTLERRVRAMLNAHLDRRPVAVRTRLLTLTAVLAIALPLAAATQPLAVVAGTLRDASGRALPNATVKLAAIGSDAAFEAQSDGGGAFSFPSVPQGDYLLSARHIGFSSVRQRVVVGSAASMHLSITLPVGTLQETINVTPGAAAASGGGARAAYTPRPCTPGDAGGQIRPPLKLRDVKPIYPENVTEAGSVLLQARINTEGKVDQIEPVTSARFDFEEAAMAAVSQWEFSPTLLNCEPVDVRMFVSVTFKTQQN